MSSESVVRFGQRMCVLAGLMCFATGITAHTFASVLLGAAMVALFVEVRGPVRPRKAEHHEDAPLFKGEKDWKP